MAIVIGTNAGFVTSTPTSDPAGSNWALDTDMIALKVTSPATATKITEIGFWCDTASEAANFEVGLYSDDSTSFPNTRLYVDSTNAKGTTSGWKSVSVDWAIDSSTIYWIAVQLDNTSTTTYTNFVSGTRFAKTDNVYSLPSSWSDDNSYAATVTVYAKWEASGGEAADTVVQINIGNTWKEYELMKINIGDSWKAVEGVQINIGDTWKEVF